MTDTKPKDAPKDPKPPEEEPPLDPTLDGDDGPTEEELASVASALSGAPSGFAAFNVTLARFIGGVHRGEDARQAAEDSRQVKAARDAGHEVEVRPV